MATATFSVTGPLPKHVSGWQTSRADSFQSLERIFRGREKSTPKLLLKRALRLKDATRDALPLKRRRCDVETRHEHLYGIRSQSDQYPLRPWLQHHGIAEEEVAGRVISTLLLLRRPGQWQDASLELLVHDAFRRGESHFEALRGSDKKTADKLFAALREARDAMRRGATPAGAISYDRDPEVEYRFPDDEP